MISLAPRRLVATFHLASPRDRQDERAATLEIQGIMVAQSGSASLKGHCFRRAVPFDKQLKDLLFGIAKTAALSLHRNPAVTERGLGAETPDVLGWRRKTAELNHIFWSLS